MKLHYILFLSFFSLHAMAQTPLQRACSRETKLLCALLPEKNLIDLDYRCMKRQYERQSPECLAHLKSVVKDPCFIDQLTSCPPEYKPVSFWQKCLPLIRTKLTPNCLKRVVLFEQIDQLVAKNCPAVTAQCPDQTKKYFRYCLYKLIDSKTLPQNCVKMISLRYDL